MVGVCPSIYTPARGFICPIPDEYFFVSIRNEPGRGQNQVVGSVSAYTWLSEPAKMVDGMNPLPLVFLCVRNVWNKLYPRKERRAVGVEIEILRIWDVV